MIPLLQITARRAAARRSVGFRTRSAVLVIFLLLAVSVVGAEPVTSSNPSRPVALKFELQFGGKGKQGMRFGGPHFVTLDAEGLIWTTEGANGRIQQFTKDGKPLRQWGNNSTDPGGFGGREKAAHNALPGPIALVFDAQQRLWVSASNDRVQVFSKTGEFLSGLLEAGSAPGQLSLPHGMVFDSKGFLYVVDSSNQRVQKFRPCKEPANSSPSSPSRSFSGAAFSGVGFPERKLSRRLRE